MSVITPIASQVRYHLPPLAKPSRPGRRRTSTNPTSRRRFTQKRTSRLNGTSAAGGPLGHGGRRGTGAPCTVVDGDRELGELLRKPHQVGDEDAHRQTVEPRRRRPAEVHVDVSALELLAQEGEDRRDAPVDAPPLDREAIVIRSDLVGDRLPRREEGDEGGRRREVHDL